MNDPREKTLRTTVYFESNYYHDKLMCKSVPRVMFFIRLTTVSWYSKIQGSTNIYRYYAELFTGRLDTE